MHVLSTHYNFGAHKVKRYSIYLLSIYIFLFQSISSYSRGDYDNGVKQGRWSLALTGLAFATFAVIVIIIVAIEAT